MTDQNDLNFTNEEKSKEKFREILPTVNYLISTNLNFMKDNDKKIDAKLYLLKNKVNQKIQKFCSEAFNYLNSQGKIIIPNQSIDGVSSDTDTDPDLDDDFSLYDFKFQNINNQDRPLVNQFISCVTEHSKEENSLIGKMNIQQEEINLEFTQCKKTCVFDKVKLAEIQDNDIIMCLNNCLTSVNKKHSLYTNEYLNKLSKFI
jgi:hypothetical protein